MSNSAWCCCKARTEASEGSPGRERQGWQFVMSDWDWELCPYHNLSRDVSSPLWGPGELIVLQLITIMIMIIFIPCIESINMCPEQC